MTPFISASGSASLVRLSDRDLLRALRELVARDREVEADLLAHLGEVDARALYLEEGCTSMFAYCTEVLHFSEASAYHRIQAARAARAYPVLLERLRRGELHLSGVKLLAPHLTPENHVELLDHARHRTKRAIEALLADRAPKPDAPSLVRKLPQSRPATAALVGRPDCDASHRATEPSIAAGGGTTAQARDAAAPALDGDSASSFGTVEPADMAGSATALPGRALPIRRTSVTQPPNSPPEALGLERFKIQFTARRALCVKLREAQALLRHQVPSGDLAEIFDRALALLVEDAKRKKFARTSRPATSARSKRGSSDKPREATRHIPAQVKRAVAARDRERCAFVARGGRCCESRDFLEFHHKEPWAGSRRHSIEGIELRCRAHNHHAAVQDFGAAHMQRYRQGGRRYPQPSTRPGGAPGKPGRGTGGEGFGTMRTTEAAVASRRVPELRLQAFEVDAS
jgi:hypothetical protein